jgi:hypothetical protein
MRAFLIDLENRPGALNEAIAPLAERGINITGGAGLSAGQGGRLALTTNDEPGTRAALDGAGITYRDLEIIGLNVPDQPGTLADATKRLGDAGVNIEALFAMPDGQTLAVAVEDADAARRALGELVVASA